MSVALANPYRYSQTIGMFVEYGRGMSNPYDVATAEDGRLFVLSRSNIFDAPLGGLRLGIMTLEEEYLGEWGVYGTDPDQLVWPSSMLFDRHGHLLISDEWRNDVLVVDAGNHRLQTFTPDGRFLRQWGSFGSAAGQLNMPWGVALDAADNVYVADWRNDRLQVFDPDGRHLAILGSAGTEDGQFRRPAGLCIDSLGNVIVADWGNERVQILRPDGTHVATLYGDATLSKWAREFLEASPDVLTKRQRVGSPEVEKRFWGAVSVRLHRAQRLYVAEHSRHRVQIDQGGAGQD